MLDEMARNTAQALAGLLNEHDATIERHRAVVDQIRDRCVNALEQLGIAVRIRDDARAASARDLEQRREAKDALTEAILEQNRLRGELARAEIARDRKCDAGCLPDRAQAVPDELVRAMTPRFHSTVERAAHERELQEEDPRFALTVAWKKGVLETSDKLYAAKASGVEASWAKVFELINILLAHPP